MSLFRLPEGWPAILAPFWPWIWVQVLMLRAYVRRTYGAGTPFQWCLDNYGRVVLLRVIPKGSEAKWAAQADPHDRIAAALDGRLFTPAYAQDSLICAHPGEGRGPERHVLHSVALDPGLRRDERVWRNLPLPETQLRPSPQKLKPTPKRLHGRRMCWVRANSAARTRRTGRPPSRSAG